MLNYILIGIISTIVACVLIYLRRVEKSGAACVGCPHCKGCGGKCGGKKS